MPLVWKSFPPHTAASACPGRNHRWCCLIGDLPGPACWPDQHAVAPGSAGSSSGVGSVSSEVKSGLYTLHTVLKFSTWKCSMTSDTQAIVSWPAVETAVGCHPLTADFCVCDALFLVVKDFPHRTTSQLYLSTLCPPSSSHLALFPSFTALS